MRVIGALSRDCQKYFLPRWTIMHSALLAASPSRTCLSSVFVDEITRRLGMPRNTISSANTGRAQRSKTTKVSFIFFYIYATWRPAEGRSLHRKLSQETANSQSYQVNGISAHKLLWRDRGHALDCAGRQ